MQKTYISFDDFCRFIRCISTYFLEARKRVLLKIAFHLYVKNTLKIF